MSGLFSTEGKFYGALSLAADLVIVNVMMLVAMLPVVTGGAALRAATVVITQLLNNEAGTPVRTFLREFTRKWKASTVWWFITTALMLFAVYEFYVIFRADVGNTTRLLLCASVLSGVCVLRPLSVWFYPIAHMGGVRSTLTHSVQLAFAPAAAHNCGGSFHIVTIVDVCGSGFSTGGCCGVLCAHWCGIYAVSGAACAGRERGRGQPLANRLSTQYLPNVCYPAHAMCTRYVKSWRRCKLMGDCRSFISGG